MIKKLITAFLILLLPFSVYGDYLRAENGMVASRSALASQVGSDILQAGGNAVDAAVATAFALAVTYPSAGNLGGGGFMVIRLADGSVYAQDARETAPQAASRDMFLDSDGNVNRGLSTNSLLASGVPGTVAGLLDALERFGSMDRRAVMAPAIKLAAEGFLLDDDLAAQFSRNLERFAEYPSSMAVFSRDGAAYEAGERWRQPELAASLERIAEQGREGFYKGETADLIVSAMQANGGLITHEDLERYQAVWREPVHATYRGYDIWSMPAPSSGGILLAQMLNMLEPYDLGQLGRDSAAGIHLLVEAQRRAYADRAEYLGDPDYVEVPAYILSSKAYARQRFADFDPQRASNSDDIEPGRWDDESPETTHFSVLDQHGNAVSLTTTLNLMYGNKFVVPGAGFLLNNEMDDFSSRPDTPNVYGLIGREANAIEPGKRMLSSMTPTIVSRDGAAYLVTGSPGGSTIINTVLQVIINIIDHGMGIEAAVSSPRIHHQWLPNIIRYEDGAISENTAAELRALGHIGITRSPFSIGDANSILLGEDFIEGMADPRNAGGVAGY